jgi:hypothetical protein
MVPAGRTLPRLIHLYTPHRSFVYTLLTSPLGFELTRAFSFIWRIRGWTTVGFRAPEFLGS